MEWKRRENITVMPLSIVLTALKRKPSSFGLCLEVHILRLEFNYRLLTVSIQRLLRIDFATELSNVIDDMTVNK